MKHIISPLDLSTEELAGVLELAEKIMREPEKYSDCCRGKKLATLFYEPSTRTRLSFEAAMLNLGGSVLGFSSADSSSASKGESVADTIRVVSGYADICAIRHPKEGAPYVAATYSNIPIINAGDGGHNHPTQTLTDLLTMKHLKGRLDHLTIGFCGDLKFGRTVHSLVNALSRYGNINFVLISPEELKLPRYVKEQSLKSRNIPYFQTTSLEEVIQELDILYMTRVQREREEVLDAHHVPYEEVRILEEIMPELDILYMTRVQRERFFNEEDYIRLKDSFILDTVKMQYARPDMLVLHPLPRVNEISVEVDSDPRAVYFKQAHFGVYVRMALILTLLELN